MSLAVLKSRALAGMDAQEVNVEVHLANGLPGFTIVGLADTEVKEAKDRVRARDDGRGSAGSRSRAIADGWLSHSVGPIAQATIAK